MRFLGVYVAVRFVRHSGSAEGKSVLGDVAFPSFLTVLPLVVLAFNPLPCNYARKPMPNFFYFDQTNQKQGPVNEQQLKVLAAQGVIGPNTPLETDNGYQGVAGQIRGLFTTASPPFTQATHAVFVPSPTTNRFCTNCGVPVSENAVTCMSCGAKPTAYRKFCQYCGAVLGPAQAMCIKCGAVISAAEFNTTGTSKKSRVTAALLAFFLGGLGIHKFYMGSTGWGILYLVFCWTYIPAILGLIEGIIYLVQSDETFAKKYPPETQSAWRW
jgi:TM2 domain-containing membrane protein YozV